MPAVCCAVGDLGNTKADEAKCLLDLARGVNSRRDTPEKSRTTSILAARGMFNPYSLLSSCCHRT